MSIFDARLERPAHRGGATSSRFSAAQRRRGRFAARAQQGERDAAHRRALCHLPRATRRQRHAMRCSNRASVQLGWTVGQNLQIDYRMAGGDADRIRRYAAELVALAPDVIMTDRQRDGRAGAAGHPHHSDRDDECRRPGRRRLRAKPGATGRQHHRVHQFRIQHEREMGGTAQADRAAA